MTRLSQVVLVAAVILPLADAVSAQAVQGTNQHTSSEQQELLNAQKSNQEAQAEYYRAQTAKLNEQTTSKELVRMLTDNPAIWGAFIAALVAILTFSFNYRSTMQTQRDTQFYEALKRFGDKDSLLMRSTAAGLLAQMGRRKVISIRQQRPYLNTALNQLLDGLQLEENQKLLSPIRNAIWQLVESAQTRVLSKLWLANRQLQNDMLVALAEFAAAQIVDIVDESNKAFWEKASFVCGYPVASLRGLVGFWPQSLWNESSKLDEETFFRMFQQISQSVKFFSEAKREEYLLATSNNLRLTAERLRENVDIFCGTLRFYGTVQGQSSTLWKALFKRRPLASLPIYFVRSSTPPTLKFMFLARGFLSRGPLWAANLPGVQMQQAVLKGAYLQQADLSGGQFQEAILRQAQLEGADLRSANLHKTQLWGAHISDSTKLEGARWWEADFRKDRQAPEIDTDLIGKLYQRYGEHVPTDFSQVHESVRVFMERKHREETLSADGRG